MSSVAIMFDNFGPYHLARLRAAANVCDLLAIEVAPASHEYGWENDSSDQGFRRVPLLKHGTSLSTRRAELWRRLIQVLDENKPEVVAIPGWVGPAALGAISWCANRRVPIICMSESTAHDQPRAAWKERAKKKIVSLFSAALVGGISHRVYLTSLGMSAERISSGYDAVDNSYFSTAADQIRAQGDQFRNQHQLPKRYFLASARFIEKKNLARLLEAYALYRAECSSALPWSLVLLGDGPLRPSLKHRITALGLEDHVLMPGFKQYADLTVYYALAGAFVHASTVEPWGLVVNEAMASGLPVLVSDRCGCAPDLVRDGYNGSTFDPLDVHAIAQKMIALSSSNSDLSQLGNASQKIIADWSPERFAGGLSQAITAALVQPTRPPAWSDRALLWLLKHR